jgi:hypothetical protein
VEHSYRRADFLDGRSKRQPHKRCWDGAMERAEQQRRDVVKRLPLRGAGRVQAHHESVVNLLFAAKLQDERQQKSRIS